MRIYKAEKKAGIDFKLNKTGSSTSFITAQVRVGDIKKYFDGMSVADLMKVTSTVQTVEELLGQKQPDLALVVAILVSTGWNLNDDIFTPEEVWKAKSSSLHKPMNDNHDAEKILGHIVQSRALDKSGNEINITADESPPVEFDIEVAGVLYRAFPELSERIDEIITKAKAGEMFVSMEAWFPDFGYGLMDATTGETKLIERTEDTAFLTKHLKIYGGCGKYQGYKVGRVLRDIIFGAQGFVDQPANPDSIIKVAAKKIAVSQSFVVAELNKVLEGGVEDVDEKQLKELQKKLEETQASLESREKEVVELQKVAKEFKDKDYDGQIATLTKKVEELTKASNAMSELFKESKTENNDLQGKLDEATQRAEKSEAELEVIRKNETAHDRLTQLSEVKEIKDKEATLVELGAMTDETFAVVLKYAGEVSDAKTDEDKEADRVKAALNSVKERKNDPDFNIAGDKKESETEKWIEMSKALCGRSEKNEGGE